MPTAIKRVVFMIDTSVLGTDHRPGRSKRGRSSRALAKDMTVGALDAVAASDVFPVFLTLLHLTHQEEIDVVAGNVIFVWSCQFLPRHRRSDEVGRDDHHEVCLRVLI